MIIYQTKFAATRLAVPYDPIFPHTAILATRRIELCQASRESIDETLSRLENGARSCGISQTEIPARVSG